MVKEIGGILRDILPSNQDFVVRNMSLLVHPRGTVQLASVIMLLISSTGVFLPLEVALNRVWGVTRNRSYVMNQLVSLASRPYRRAFTCSPSAWQPLRPTSYLPLFRPHPERFLHFVHQTS